MQFQTSQELCEFANELKSNVSQRLSTEFLFLSSEVIKYRAMNAWKPILR
jgi:hypothetical protein